MSTEDLSARLVRPRQDRAAGLTDREFETLLACVAGASGLDLDWGAEDEEEWARFIDADRGKVAILVSRHSDLCFVLTGHESSFARCDQQHTKDVVVVADFEKSSFCASPDALLAFCGDRASGSIAQGVVDPDHFSIMDLWYLCP